MAGRTGAQTTEFELAFRVERPHSKLEAGRPLEGPEAPLAAPPARPCAPLCPLESGCREERMARVLSLRGGFRSRQGRRGRKGCGRPLSLRAAEGKVKSYGDVARGPDEEERKRLGGGRYSCKGGSRVWSLRGDGRGGLGTGQALGPGFWTPALQPPQMGPCGRTLSRCPFHSCAACNAGSTKVSPESLPSVAHAL